MEERTLSAEGLQVNLWGGTGAQPWTNWRSAIIGDPISVSATPRFNKIGAAEVVLPADWGRGAGNASALSRAESLRVPNAWLEIKLRGRRVFTGPITAITTTGPADGTIALKCQAHIRAIWGGVIEPASTDSLQVLSNRVYKVTYGGENRILSGQAADVFNRYAQGAIGPQFVIGTVPDWPGTEVSAKVRMKTLDTLIPLIDQFDIGVDVDPEVDIRHLVFYRGTVLERLLTDRSGIVTEWEATHGRPTVTGAIVGGQGEAKDRVFVVDHSYENQSTNTQVRDDRSYVFVDARDADDDAILVKRAKEAIAEGAAKVSLKATLAEGLGFRFVDDFWLGDRITFSLADDTLKLTERVNEVQIDWTRDQGLVVTPKVGDINDSPEARYVNAIRGIGQRTTNLETR